MDLKEMTASPRHRLILPGIAGFYHQMAQPFGWLVFRAVLGGMLVYVGWEKILAPFAMAGFMSGVLGLPAGALFSAILAVILFFGGGLIVLGLWTRPAALAAGFVLLVTLWFHITHPYGTAFLTAEGLAMVQGNNALLTREGQQFLLGDGGAAFLAQVQQKAVFTSLLWSLGVALVAAFGGGRFSADRALGREF